MRFGAVHVLTGNGYWQAMFTIDPEHAPPDQLAAKGQAELYRATKDPLVQSGDFKDITLAGQQDSIVIFSGPDKAEFEGRCTANKDASEVGIAWGLLKEAIKARRVNTIDTYA